MLAEVTVWEVPMTMRPEIMRTETAIEMINGLIRRRPDTFSCEQQAFRISHEMHGSKGGENQLAKDYIGYLLSKGQPEVVVPGYLITECRS
jgi:hypothetical protein